MNHNQESSASNLRIGTRGSELARRQAGRIKDRLESAYPELTCELVVISTQGDRDKETPLTVIGGQGVFAKELQMALAAGEVDCAVHSLKDLPPNLPEELTLAAVLDRDDPRDVLISPTADSLAELPHGARVGTSSRRRMAQLLDLRPDVEMVELRGNVDTRMRKVLEGSAEQYDAAILAAAGVVRMGWRDRIAAFLDVDQFTPAPGQAALAAECRADDQATRRLLEAISDPETELATEVERAFLRSLGAGCSSPVAAYAKPEGDELKLWLMIAREDLRSVRRVARSIPRERAVETAAGLGRELLAQVTSE